MTETKKRMPWFTRLMLGITLVAGLIALTLPFLASRLACRPNKNSCIANLKQIDGAIQQWALENKLAETNAPVLAEAVKYLKGGVLPICPFGGSYAAGKTVADPPTCTTAAELGHSLP
jgi:hypothetical protein